MPVYFPLVLIQFSLRIHSYCILFITFLPTGVPSGFVTSHVPIQKSKAVWFSVQHLNCSYALLVTADRHKNRVIIIGFMSFDLISLRNKCITNDIT